MTKKVGGITAYYNEKGELVNIFDENGDCNWGDTVYELH